MAALFSRPSVPKFNPVPQSTMKDASAASVVSNTDEFKKRLAAMIGRQQTVLTGPLGEMNRKKVLGA